MVKGYANKEKEIEYSFVGLSSFEISVQANFEL